MGRTEDILKNYNELDACGRMCLYLQYTDLREEFTAIERNETGPVPELKESPSLLSRVKAWFCPAVPEAT